MARAPRGAGRKRTTLAEMRDGGEALPNPNVVRNHTVRDRDLEVVLDDIQRFHGYDPALVRMVGSEPDICEAENGRPRMRLTERSRREWKWPSIWE